MQQTTRLTLFIILMLVTFSMMIAITVFASGRTVQGKLALKRPVLPLGVLKEMTIPERIYKMSIAQGLTEYEANRMVNISFCESTFRPDAQNTHSSAAGLFGIIRSTWNANSDKSFEEYRYNEVENIKTALTIFKRSGFHPWVCNKLI